MIAKETEIFEQVLEQSQINIVNIDNGLYQIKYGNTIDYVQTNGYNLLESLRRLVNTQVVEDRLL